MKVLVHWYSDTKGYQEWIHRFLEGEFHSLIDAKNNVLTVPPPEEGFLPAAVQDIKSGRLVRIGEHLLEVPDVLEEFRASLASAPSQSKMKEEGLGALFLGHRFSR